MPRLPGVSHRQAVRVFEKLGYKVRREGKHTVMARDSGKILVIPRHAEIDEFTMGGIAKDAGLTPASTCDIRFSRLGRRSPSQARRQVLKCLPAERLKIGAPVGSRTPNLLIRSQMLYPIELRARGSQPQSYH